MRPTRFLFVLALLAAAHTAFAQSDAMTDPREFSEAARKLYAGSLKDARALMAAKKYTEAIAILDKLTAERPREPQARFLKGLALADSGKADAAIVIFQAVLGDFPELPEPHNNLAVLYAQKGEFGLARDELEAAIRAAPDYAIAYENLGDIYARLAAQNYEKALARDARNKSVPAKLKLVREVLAPVAAVPAAAVPPEKPAAAVTSPAVAPSATPALPAGGSAPATASEPAAAAAPQTAPASTPAAASTAPSPR